MNLYGTGLQNRLHKHHGEAGAAMAVLQTEIKALALDPGLLQLCQDYFAAALRQQTWSPPEPVSEVQQASLAFCEQYRVSVAQVSPEHISALRQHLDADEVYNLINAVYVIEMAQRLDLTLEQLIA